MYGHHHKHGPHRDPRTMFGGHFDERCGREWMAFWADRLNMLRSREIADASRMEGGKFHPFDERPEFGFSEEEGEIPMFGNGRDWRGGPRGRERHDFGPGFGRGGGRPERPFEQGDLRWLVLDLIAVQPRHGYEIIKAIGDMLNGQYTPSPGVIYPTLTYLEETGSITGEAQGGKKLYSLTDEGRAALEANAESLQAIRSRIEAARGRFGGQPAPEMMRAMDNLRSAIHVRLSKGDLSPESLAVITAALDRAAGEIERS